MSSTPLLKTQAGLCIRSDLEKIWYFKCVYGVFGVLGRKMKGLVEVWAFGHP